MVLKLRWPHITLWIVLLLPCAVHAQTEAPEYQIKAAMLYNFTLFVDWPRTPMPDSNAFHVGIIGDDPFGQWLGYEFENARVENHPVIISHLSSALEGRLCQIVFISQSVESTAAAILDTLRGANVLTVSDMANFCASGGTIGFVMENNKIRFMLNTDAADLAGLIIDSRLKRVAFSIVTDRK